MADNDYDRILRLRNETSLSLDDLVALTVNSSLAFELRLFSAEIMDLKPGFAFSLKQARELRDITRKTLKHYQAHTVSDDGLMNYLVAARAVLKGKEQAYGGGQMGFIDKILHGKEIKKQESMRRLEQDFKDVCNQILACESEMARCIENSRGCAPDSMTYRNNERTYNTEKNKLALLKQQMKILDDALDHATRIRLMEDFNTRLKAISGNIDNALGDEKERDRTVARAEQHSETIRNTLQSAQGYGETFFSAQTEETRRPDSEFASQVAASERRQAMMNNAGVSEAEVKAKLAEPENEFSRLVNAGGTKE